MRSIPWIWILSGTFLCTAAHAQRAHSVVEWDGESSYHFTPDGAYFEHKRSAGRAVEERPIAGKWGCVTFPVDASVNFGNRKIYFFFGNQYARYDMDRNACDPGYPKLIAGGGWPGLPWAADLDAAVAYKGKAYFFKGSQYVRYDIAADRADPGYPKTISAGWPGLWSSDIDAAVNNGAGKVIFFKGDKSMSYDIAAELADGPESPALQYLLGPDAPRDQGARLGLVVGDDENRDMWAVVRSALRRFSPERALIVNGHEIATSWEKDRLGNLISFYNWKTDPWPRAADGDFRVAPDLRVERRTNTVIQPMSGIVLHETTGLKNLRVVTASRVHFFIDWDGTIFQLFDTNTRHQHAANGPIERRSIGIEFANPMFDFDPAKPGVQGQYKNRKGDLACATLPAPDESPRPQFPFQWKSKPRSCSGQVALVAPHARQLEALVWLCRKLFELSEGTGGETTYGLKLPRVWRNLWPHPEHPGLGAPLDPATKYVLLHTAFPISPKPPGADLGKPPVFQPVEMPGIVSHSIIAGDDHSDGAGLAVYTWLRIQKGLEPMPAYAMMMAVLGAPQASGTDADDLLPIPGGPLPTMVTDEKVVQKILAPEGFAAGVSGFPYVTIVRLPRVLWGAPVPPGPR